MNPNNANPNLNYWPYAPNINQQSNNSNMNSSTEALASHRRLQQVLKSDSNSNNNTHNNTNNDNSSDNNNNDDNNNNNNNNGNSSRIDGDYNNNNDNNNNNDDGSSTNDSSSISSNNKNNNNNSNSNSTNDNSSNICNNNNKNDNISSTTTNNTTNNNNTTNSSSCKNNNNNNNNNTNNTNSISTNNTNECSSGSSSSVGTKRKITVVPDFIVERKSDEDHAEGSGRQASGGLVFRGGMFYEQQDQEGASLKECWVGASMKESWVGNRNMLLSIPPHWPRGCALGERILVQNTETYKAIRTSFIASINLPVVIHSITEVCNVEFMEKYQWQKWNMIKKMGERSTNEKLLYHGSNPTSVEAICAQNFDWRLNGKHGVLYGKGTYFARDASLAYKYSTPESETGARYMFVASVLVGRSALGSRDMVRPPPMMNGVTSTARTELYDSCVNCLNDPTTFVIFERDQCYPRYLITYEDAYASRANR